MQKYIYHYTIFGQVQDSEAYGGGGYNTAEYGDTSRTQNEVDLARTGEDFLAPLLIGIAMVIGSVIAFVKMRKSKQA